MKFLNKYSLYILSAYAIVMLLTLVTYWDSLAVVQRFAIGFLALLTLHEWEETRFPGGFYEMMGGIMKLDISKAPEGALHLPPAVLIVVLTLLPMLFPGVATLFLALMYFGLAEGFVHIAGIKLARSQKPYTPGMITALAMFVYAIVGISFAASRGMIAPLDWLLGIIVFLGGFALMDASVYRILGLKPTEVMKRMQANLKGQQG